MRATLAKSLSVDFLLTAICLPHRDNPGDIAAASRVGVHDCSTGEQAQSDKPFLCIIKTTIYERYARAVQRLRDSPTLSPEKPRGH
jgi:hypothetical protein